MKPASYTILLFIVLSTQWVAQDPSIFPKDEISTTDDHTGAIWLNEN